MEFTSFHNILIVFFITFKFYQNNFTIGQFVSEVIPENYQLLLNFTGNDDCSVKKCMYGGQVIITMLVTGKAIFTLQSDPETKIDESKTKLYRIYPNDTSVPANITNFIYTSGDVSTIIEIEVEQIFHMMSESQFELTLHFTREFDNQNGIYGADAESHNDTILMMTNLISTRLYRLFPCLSDQHKWTSTFELSLLHSSKYSVMTGVPLIEETAISPNTNISVFKKTKKIPSEHFFFIIWRYAFHNAGPLNFFFPSNIDNIDFTFMAGFTIKCFKWISNSTGTIAPVFPMMNIAPVSNSLMLDYYTAPGVTLVKKQRVLFNDEESTTNDKLELITTVSRAVVSQWIGISIYPELRSDFWLYQALAHYVADFMMEFIEPAFRIRESSLARTLLWTRCDRDLQASTTIPFYLFDTWDDKMYFRREDYQSYQAMTLIAMIHEIYDFEDIGTLLKYALMRWGQYEFGPSQTDMVKSLERQNVNEMIKDWTKMPGIPVIHVTLDITEEYAQLIQERFNPSGPYTDDRFAWTIPIRCKNLSTNKHYFHWMKRDEPLSMKADEIKNCFLNTVTVVPYRVNYPETWWLDIIRRLKNNPEDMSETLKMRIIDDLLEFCLAGYIQISVLFDLLSYLSNEMEYFPWLAGAKALTKLSAILGTGKKADHKVHFKQLTLEIISDVYDYVESQLDEPTNPDDVERNDDLLSNHYFRLHRKNILNIACGFGHKKCLRDAGHRLNCYIEEVSSDQCQNGRCHNLWKKCIRDADEREIIICQGLRHAGIERWISVLQLLNATDLFPSARLAISRGLACTENHDILENYVYYVLHDSKMFPAENIFPILLTAARINEMNSQIILHFIIKNHEVLIERLKLPDEFQKQMFALSQDIFVPKLNSERTNFQGSPLTYTDLPKSVQKILEVNTLRANRLRPMIEEYLDDYQKNIHV